jgi:hypothetical protein
MRGVSPGLGAWLPEAGGSLAFSTYQSARIFFLFADDKAETVAQERMPGVFPFAAPRPAPEASRPKDERQQ